MIRILGFGNILVTGLQGAGKTHFVMSQIAEIVESKPDMRVYLVNIDGVKISHPNVSIETADFNWVTDAQQNSLIVYDEAGTIDRFSNSSSRINSDEQVQNLTMARHAGKTIIFVAQDSMIVHPAIRRLLTRHYHFSNPYNDPDKTHAFVFPQVQDRLDGQSKYWQKNAIEEFKHELDSNIFSLYKSVDDGAKHNKKKQMNQKAKKYFIYVAVILVFLIPIFLFTLIYGYKWYKSKTAKPHISDDVVSVSPVGTAVDTIKPNLQTEQQSQMIDVSNQDYSREIQLYEQRLPDDYRILSSNDDLRIAGVVSMGSQCLAYNVRGDRINVSYEQCMRYIDNQGSIIKRSSRTGVITSHDAQPQQNSTG